MNSRDIIRAIEADGWRLKRVKSIEKQSGVTLRK
jgi:predicted RNA binding protein YcfA (HicA-like mRNA interferase family)